MAPELPPPPSQRSAPIVVMGVSGSGKSTFARALAAELSGSFLDADDFHPAENVAKMARGEPLQDADRWEWLDRLRVELVDWESRPAPVVLACSALRWSYRERLRGPAKGGVAPLLLRLVFLDGPREELGRRLTNRENHFMPVSLLDSQLSTLEPPTDAEAPIRVDFRLPLAEAVDQVRRQLGD